jgi:toxin secretion/phage lysis holin
VFFILPFKGGAKVTKDFFNAGVGVVGSVVTWMFGGWSAVLELLLILVAIDYLTGFAVAITEGKLSSSVGFKGIAKKVAIFLILFIGHKLDLALNLDNWLFYAAAFFYISNEFLSLTENLGKIGVPIPEAMKKAVAQLRERGEK